MSCLHGVTTVAAGNCGLSVAPCKKQDRAALTAIFARVEDMDPIAMSGITWDEFETFRELLDEDAETARGGARHAAARPGGARGAAPGG
jgi:N-acyl-D-aspartate/D-glutamate deacylase